MIMILDILRLKRLEVDDKVLDCGNKIVTDLGWAGIDFETGDLLPEVINRYLNYVRRETWGGRSKYPLDSHFLVSLELLGGREIRYQQNWKLGGDGQVSTGESIFLDSDLFVSWGGSDGEDSIPIIGPAFDGNEDYQDMIIQEYIYLTGNGTREPNSPWLWSFLAEGKQIMEWLRHGIITYNGYTVKGYTSIAAWTERMHQLGLLTSFKEDAMIDILNDNMEKIFGRPYLVTKNGIREEGMNLVGWFSPREMGSGFQTAMIVLALVYTALKENKTVFINPIDASLHPLSARALMGVIKELFENGEKNNMGQLLYTRNGELTPIYELDK
jgi:hypothetical protein